MNFQPCFILCLYPSTPAPNNTLKRHIFFCFTPETPRIRTVLTHCLSSHGWLPLFWFGACPPVLIIIFRLCLPETDAFRERELVREERGNISGTFMAQGKWSSRNIGCC